MDELAEPERKVRDPWGLPEPCGNNFGAPVWDLWEVIRELDPSGPGASMISGMPWWKGAQSWPLGLKLLKDHIRCMVIKDFKWGEEDGKWRSEMFLSEKGWSISRPYFRLAEAIRHTRAHITPSRVSHVPG